MRIHQAGRLALVLSLVLVPATAVTYESFNYPGGFYTTARAVTSAGAVAGEYYDEFMSESRGFVRDAQGQFTSFAAASDAVYTMVAAMNESGAIAGSYTNTDGAVAGYVRTSAGATTTFKYPGSLRTQPFAMNAGGAVVGTYLDGGFQQRGFVRNPDGSFVSIDVPGAGFTGVYGISQSGQLAGDYGNGDQHRGFLGNAGAPWTTFDPAGSVSTFPKGINDAGVIAGYFEDAAMRRHGFIRRTDGTYFVFDVPGAIDTYVVGISQTGGVIGSALSLAGMRGYVRDAAGNIDAASPVGATYSFTAGVNANGVVVGYWEDAAFLGQAFVRTDCQTPKITSLTATPDSIWPPNNKMVPVSVSAATEGGCGTVTTKITSIASNDPAASPSDWSISGNLTANVRATKASSGDRIYILTVEAVDSTLKTATKTVTVTVPQNRGR